MKSYFVFIPLAGLMFLVLIASLNQKAQTNPNKSSAKDPSVLLKETIRFASDIKREDPRRRADEAVAEVDRLIRVSSAQTSSKFAGKLTEALLRFRESRYQSLFESWGLDSLTRDRVLEIVRDREYAMMENRRSFSSQGVEGMSKLVSESVIEKSLADEQLVKLIGSKRLLEMKNEEAKMDSIMLKQAQSLVGANDQD